MSVFTCFPNFPIHSSSSHVLSGSDVVSCCSSLLVSLDVSPSVPSGVPLFGCVSALVALHLFPALSICVRLRMSFLCFHLDLSLIMCLAPSVSYFICFRIHAFPVICLPWWRCPALVSSWFDLCFVLVSVLYFLCVFLLLKIKSCSTMASCVLPLVSHLSPILSLSYCLRYKCHYIKIETVWHENMLLVIHAGLSWHDQKLPASGAAIDME